METKKIIEGGGKGGHHLHICSRTKTRTRLPVSLAGEPDGQTSGSLIDVQEKKKLAQLSQSPMFILEGLYFFFFLLSFDEVFPPRGHREKVLLSRRGGGHRPPAVFVMSHL